MLLPISGTLGISCTNKMECSLCSFSCLTRLLEQIPWTVGYHCQDCQGGRGLFSQTEGRSHLYTTLSVFIKPHLCTVMYMQCSYMKMIFKTTAKSMLR